MSKWKRETEARLRRLEELAVHSGGTETSASASEESYSRLLDEYLNGAAEENGRTMKGEERYGRSIEAGV